MIIIALIALIASESAFSYEPTYLTEIAPGDAYTLTIPLPKEQWTMVSLNLYPGAVSIPNIFTEVEADSLVIQNYTGYIERRNSLGFWDDSLSFTWNMMQGFLVWTRDDSIFLPELIVSDTGWYDIDLPISFTPYALYDTCRNSYFITYTPCWDMPCSTAFAEFLDWNGTGDTVLVWACQYNTGKTYFPDQNAVIYSMRQGEGYWLKMERAIPYNGFNFTTLTEPPLENIPGGAVKDMADNNSTIESFSSNHFQYRKCTPGLYPIVLENIEIEGVYPELGDEIGVFLWDSVCVGAAEYSGEPFLIITAWEDEIMTPDSIDGYIGGEVMSFKYWDDSESQELDLNLTCTINSLPPSSNTLFSVAPIFGNRYYAKISFGVTPNIEIPENFVLHQNYPNPFNPSTTIKFDLPEPSKVRLEVFNILGQKVVTLKDQIFSAGYKEIRWDSKSESGFEVGSGIYFYRIDVKGLTTGKCYLQTKKMMILK